MLSDRRIESDLSDALIAAFATVGAPNRSAMMARPANSRVCGSE
jgi:hypothetical protein